MLACPHAGLFRPERHQRGCMHPDNPKNRGRGCWVFTSQEAIPENYRGWCCEGCEHAGDEVIPIHPLSQDACAFQGRAVRDAPCGCKQLFKCNYHESPCTTGNAATIQDQFDTAGDKRKVYSCRGCRAKMTVGVVIISHNYGRFLGEAIASVRGQTVPCAVLVVDDSSTDETAAVAKECKVPYLRIEAGNVNAARQAGYQAMKTDLLIFLDADDVLPKDYIEQALPLLKEDTVGIVHSDVQMFGDSSVLRTYDAALISLERWNQVHAGSVVRRAALTATGVFSGEVPGPEIQDDWWIWRTLLRAGWTAVKQPSVYQYRRHEANRSKRRRTMTYYDLAGLAHETVTVFTPFAGGQRREFLPEYLDWARQLNWPADQLQWLWLDTSDDADLREQLRNTRFPDSRIVTKLFGRPGLADDDRTQPQCRDDVQATVAQIYSWMRQQVTTPYLLIVEDDVLPPVDVVERLLRGFDAGTNSVSGAVPSRFADRFIAWRKWGDDLTTPGNGIESIGGNGFACVLLRNEALQSTVITTNHACPDYDRAFYEMLPSGTAKIDWGVMCEHRDIQREPVVPGSPQCPSCKSTRVEMWDNAYHGDSSKTPLDKFPIKWCCENCNNYGYLNDVAELSEEPVNSSHTISQGRRSTLN